MLISLKNHRPTLLTIVKQNCSYFLSRKQGIQLSKMKKQLKKSIPSNVKTCITYKGTKLSTQFPVKDRTKFEHGHNILYFSHCPNVTCNEKYVGETDRKIKECIMDHKRRYKSSQLLKHAPESQHIHIWNNDFKILIKSV